MYGAQCMLHLQGNARLFYLGLRRMYEEKFWAIYLKHVRSILKDFDGTATAKAAERAEPECAAQHALACCDVLYCAVFATRVLSTLSHSEELRRGCRPALRRARWSCVCAVRRRAGGRRRRSLAVCALDRCMSYRCMLYRCMLYRCVVCMLGGGAGTTWTGRWSLTGRTDGPRTRR